MSISCSGPVSIYLKSLGGDRLLTGPEEKELARRIEGEKMVVVRVASSERDFIDSWNP